jgi:hypothetical protein
MKNKFKFLVIVMILLAMTGIVSAADGTGTETTLGYLNFLKFTMAAVITASLGYYNAHRKTGEAFDWNKFLPVVYMGILASFVLWYFGLTEISAYNIQAWIEQYAPILEAGGLGQILISAGSLGTIAAIGQQLWKKIFPPATETVVVTNNTTTTTPASTTTTTTTPASSDPVNLPDGGCTVNPSLGGKVFHLIYGLPSPATIAFALDATQPAADHSGYVSCDIDWNDGTFQLVPLVKGHADVDHTFKFVPIAHYTGMTFNPVFTFNENTGEKMVVNGEGRTVEIGVESP